MKIEKLGTIDELADDWRQDIGTTYTWEELGKIKGVPTKPWTTFNKDVTRNAVKHFVDAMGDLNPLYRDRDYAKTTKYGCLIAPPCYLHSVILGPAPMTKGPMAGNIHGFDSGHEWEWFRPLCEGDEFDFKVITPSDVEVKSSKFGGKLAIHHGRAEITRQGGELVAIDHFWSIYMDRNESQERNTYKDIAKPTEYTEEYIKKVYTAQDAEIIRGSKPRYWEDVNVGEELQPVVIGPYTYMEGISWLIGSGMSISVSDRIYRKMHARHGKAWYDPLLKIEQNLNITHFYDDWAKSVGLPKPYDFGGQRYSWLGMLLTHWIGDEGFVWKMRAEHRNFSVMGDVIWCKGKVIKKYIDNGRYCVDIEMRAENQTGKVLSPGSATLLLPSKEKGPVIYPEYQVKI